MNCNWCKYQINKNCVNNNSCISFSEYEPKDKQMENKVIFESEEEAIKFYKNNLDVIRVECSYFVACMKSGGYIRKKAVEEAEEMYMDYLMRGLMPPLRSDTTKLLNKMYKAIQELKAENERLKK